MKQSLVIILILISLISVKCQNEANTGSMVQKRDTTRTLAVHLNYGLRSIKYGPANRITVDSLHWVGTDSTTMKKKWAKITYYEVIVEAVVDSVLSRQFKVPVLDATGKPNVINLRINADSKYVRDTISDLDADVKSLEQYVIKDSTQKK